MPIESNGAAHAKMKCEAKNCCRQLGIGTPQALRSRRSRQLRSHLLNAGTATRPATHGSLSTHDADPNTGGTLGIPTEEELQTGKFYKDIDEYRKAHGLSDAA
jgi:hypothetical protein